MSYLAPSTSSFQSTIIQGAISGDFQRRSPHSIASVHILDDDSLLHVFHLYRPFFLGEDQDDNARLFGGKGRWVRGRWWHKLAHVCQRWRNVILGSSSYLDLSLVCTNGTPVSDMLANSPPLPLVIDYSDKYHDFTTEDEEGVILSFKQRDRVRRVRLRMHVTSLSKFVVAVDEEYPILEHLVIMKWKEDNSTVMIFPETLQAPRLCHLALSGVSLPIGSRLLTTAVGLVTIYLFMDHPSTYLRPDTLLQSLSVMPQLEMFVLKFVFPVSNRDVEWQLTHMPIMTPAILPNLRRFGFRGVSTYLEALICRIAAPRLEKLETELFNQLMFSVPRLLQLMNTTENLRFDSAKFEFFRRRVHMKIYSRREAEMYALSITVFCSHLDWQVSSMAQISSSLSQMFSAVEHLTLGHKVHSQSSEERNHEVDRVEWRNLLRSFSNVKTLRIDNGLVKQLSRCLELNDGELPLGLLSELQELKYPTSRHNSDAFTSFIDARQSAGRPLILVRL